MTRAVKRQSSPSSETARPSYQAVAERLERWYEKAGRDLPWRRTSDPWEIWVSEIMLQQTRVSVVRERYLEFLVSFPDCQSLAEADDASLLTAWKGLGYYRRIKQLREAATRVVQCMDGKIPDDPELFGSLPGIGTYTKGAVMSIAFNQPLPAIDGNALRVLSRVLAINGDPRKKPALALITSFIEGMLRHANPRRINQAIMDLGATICLPKKPQCGSCPVLSACKAGSSGIAESFPQLPKRPKTMRVKTELGIAVQGGLLLSLVLPPGSINEGQRCLPGLGLPIARDRSLEEQLAIEWGISLRKGRHLGSFKHAITRYQVQIELYELEPAPRLSKPGVGLSYEDPRDENLPWSTVSRKALRILAQHEAGKMLLRLGGDCR